MSVEPLPSLKTVVSKAGMGVIAAGLTVAVLGVSCTRPARLLVPDDSDRLASGRGTELIRATTTRPGRLHVLDRADENVVWVGEAQAGQTLVVDGSHHKITLDRQTVFEGVRGDHHYVVFFSHLNVN